jgi:predicted rRNA methylase YqxC with S4 and FtsJ domains
MDLSYLSVAGAICQLDRRMMAPDAQLIALVKPTFELRAATMADAPEQVAAAVDAATDALEKHGWRVHGRLPSPIRGAKGALEVLVHAGRISAPGGSPAREPARGA